jgi:hypothetical protein
MLARALFLLLAASAVRAEDVVPQSSILLGKIRAHMVDILSHEPSYTCVQTMERMQRSAGRNFQMTDTLRLEVALVEGKEMFAWPGSKKFESDDLRNMITTGAYGNGSFALFARAVFGGNIATFTYVGEETLKGKSLVRYNYRVSQLMSGYTIRMKEHEEIVGYHGSFWADPKSLDVRRLEVFADDIPAILELGSAFNGIDYTRMPIGGSDFLLPTEAQLAMQHSNGDESKNFTRFTACRQYTGESVLRFDDFDDSGEPQDAGDTEFEVPSGLDLRISLAEDVDMDKAAAGDVIRGTLTGDLKQKGVVLAPKGSAVEGRITRVERYKESTSVGIVLTDLHASGKHASIHPDFESALMGVLGVKPVTFLLHAPLPHEGLLQLRPGRVVLHRGILMYWRT